MGVCRRAVGGAHRISPSTHRHLCQEDQEEKGLAFHGAGRTKGNAHTLSN